MRKILTLRARKGFTLIEVLCATIIFAILIVAVFALFDPINRINKMIKGDSGAERLILTTEEYISSQVRMASSVELYRVDDWEDMARFIDAFRTANPVPEDFPNALIIKKEVAAPHTTYLYNINLKDSAANPDLADVIAINTTLTSDTLEKYRLYNRSFYDGVNLDITMRIDGGNLMKVSIEAKRDGDVRARSSREDVVNMINMGKTNPYHTGGIPSGCAANAYALNALGDPITLPDPDPDWTGDYLLLYNNISVSTTP